jgi:uncharacterized protein YndB with AHSA1/START domain
MAVTSSGPAKVTLPADDQILITREFDAPRHLVYKAWTTPELVRQWWSGERGTMTACEIDLRVGGTWRYAMNVRDGEFEIAFNGEYREIVPDEKLVHTEIFEQMPPAEGEEPVLNVVTFTEVDGGTRLDLLVLCPSQEIRDGIVESGMEGGLQEQMVRLDKLLPTLA